MRPATMDRQAATDCGGLRGGHNGRRRGLLSGLVEAARLSALAREMTHQPSASGSATSPLMRLAWLPIAKVWRAFTSSSDRLRITCAEIGANNEAIYLRRSSRAADGNYGAGWTNHEALFEQLVERLV
jgi:hypothetical protein